jgi:hypothetical protein
MKAFLGGTLIDGTGGSPVHDAGVLVNDAGRIEAGDEEGKVYSNRLPPQRVTSAAG